MYRVHSTSVLSVHSLLTDLLHTGKQSVAAWVLEYRRTTGAPRAIQTCRQGDQAGRHAQGRRAGASEWTRIVVRFSPALTRQHARRGVGQGELLHSGAWAPMWILAEMPRRRLIKMKRNLYELLQRTSGMYMVETSWPGQRYQHTLLWDAGRNFLCREGFETCVH